MKVIAHRGASAAKRENTLEAFTHARVLGADWVELDVRRTADGAMAVHHDAHLPDGRALVATAAADLPPHVPSLAAALDTCAGMGVNVEIKNWPDDVDFDADAALAAQVVEVLDTRGRRDRVLVSCFHLGTLDRVRALDASLPTAWLVEPVSWDARRGIDALVRHGHGALHPHWSMVDGPLVVACHGAGVAVHVWTVDDPDEMRRLAGLGVDGICTNVPDVLVSVLAEG